jgi:hypothetical protein
MFLATGSQLEPANNLISADVYQTGEGVAKFFGPRADVVPQLILLSVILFASPDNLVRKVLGSSPMRGVAWLSGWQKVYLSWCSQCYLL